MNFKHTSHKLNLTKRAGGGGRRLNDADGWCARLNLAGLLWHCEPKQRREMQRRCCKLGVASTRWEEVLPGSGVRIHISWSCQQLIVFDVSLLVRTKGWAEKWCVLYCFADLNSSGHKTTSSWSIKQLVLTPHNNSLFGCTTVHIDDLEHQTSLQFWCTDNQQHLLFCFFRNWLHLHIKVLLLKNVSNCIGPMTLNAEETTKNPQLAENPPTWLFTQNFTLPHKTAVWFAVAIPAVYLPYLPFNILVVADPLSPWQSACGPPRGFCLVPLSTRCVRAHSSFHVRFTCIHEYIHHTIWQQVNHGCPHVNRNTAWPLSEWITTTFITQRPIRQSTLLTRRRRCRCSSSRAASLPSLPRMVTWLVWPLKI